MDGYDVRPITRELAAPWIIHKHYAHRMPIVQYAYGLFKDGVIEGVCTFGSPPSPHLCRGICGDEYSGLVVELNRLVLNYNKKNEASFLVSKSIKLMCRPKILVSFADSGQNHCGYIYQATNWIYTGAVTAHDSEYIINGKKTHARNLTSMGISATKKYADENNIERIKPQPKHRYIYFIGSKKQKKEFLNELRYKIMPYPKGTNTNYDSSKQIPRQTFLF